MGKMKRRMKRSPKRYSPETWEAVRKMREQGMKFDEVAKLMDMPRPTIIDREKKEGWITDTNLNRQMKKIEAEGSHLPLMEQEKGVVLNENPHENGENTLGAVEKSHNSLTVNADNSTIAPQGPQNLQELIETKGLTIETRAQIMLSHELDIAEKTALMAGQLLTDALRVAPTPESWAEIKTAQAVMRTAVDTVRPKDSGPNIQVNLFNQAGSRPRPKIDI